MEDLGDKLHDTREITGWLGRLIFTTIRSLQWNPRFLLGGGMIPLYFSAIESIYPGCPLRHSKALFGDASAVAQVSRQVHLSPLRPGIGRRVARLRVALNMSLNSVPKNILAAVGGSCGTELAELYCVLFVISTAPNMSRPKVDRAQVLLRGMNALNDIADMNPDSLALFCSGHS